MKRCNVIALLDASGQRVLVCHRIKMPYQGLLNFVGGKVESGEASEAAAYRELWEETGLQRQDVTLAHVMDFHYPREGIILEAWCGRLREERPVSGTENPLLWVSAAENFFDDDRFAGRGNMGHILALAREYGLLERE